MDIKHAATLKWPPLLLAAITLLLSIGPARCPAVVFDYTQNLVLNGDAEDDFTRWTYVVNGSIAADNDGAVGTQSFQADAAGAAYAEFVHETIDITGGERLELHVSFKTLTGATSGATGAQVYLRYYNTSNTWLGQDVINLALTSNQWQPFHQDFVTLPAAARVDIYIAIGKWGAFDGIARFDNVSLYRQATLSETTAVSPADNTKFAANEQLLAWSPADQATGYDVYLGTDMLAVQDADRLFCDLSLDGAVGQEDLAVLAQHWRQSPTGLTPSPDLHPDGKVDLADFAVLTRHWGSRSDTFTAHTGRTSYPIGPLPLGHTYFWRVDTVHDSQIVPGSLQSINISHAPLDDMESYGGANPVWDHWQDGRYNNTGATASLVTDPVHDHTQALHFAYDNSGAAGKAPYALVEREFPHPQDWTTLQAELLWIHFYGAAANTAQPGETLYLELADSSGVRTRIRYDNRYGSGDDILKPRWQLWQVNLEDITALDLSQIEKVALGFGDPDASSPGGSGAIIFDDIRLLAQHNQLFPPGPPPAPAIDYVDLRSASMDTILAAVTLQGHVNNAGASHLYYIISNEDLFWRDQMQAQGHFDQLYLKSLFIAFTKYSSYYDKVIIYDPALPATINIATMMAAVDKGVVINAADLGQFGAGKQVVDLRGAFSTNTEAYQWAFDNLWPQMRHDVLAIYHPTATSHHIRDYLVQNRIFTFWVTGRNAEDGVTSDYDLERAFAEQLFAETPINAPVIGWWGTLTDDGLTEYGGVGLAGQYGKLAVGCDWTTNLSILSGIDVDWAQKVEQYRSRPIPAAPAFDNSKVYVCIAILDAGDAPVYWQAIQHYVWQDAQRGNFPIGWCLGPGSLDLMPGIMEWFYDQAAGNDHFFISPSGSGYVHPYRDFMGLTTDPQAGFDAYLSLTNYHMKWLGLDTACLYTDSWKTYDRTIHDPTAMKFVDALENLDVLILGMGRDEGIVDYNYAMGPDNTLITHATTRWDATNIGRNPANISWMVNEIQTHTPAQRPAFMLVYPISWNYWPSDLAAVLSQLGSDYVPVSPASFKALYEESLP